MDIRDVFECLALAPAAGLQVIIGSGAVLLHLAAPVAWIDIPKNELQYHMRAGVVCNLGNDAPEQPAEMYKRYYFVDWPVLDAYKQNLLARIMAGHS